MTMKWEMNWVKSFLKIHQVSRISTEQIWLHGTSLWTDDVNYSRHHRILFGYPA